MPGIDAGVAGLYNIDSGGEPEQDSNDSESGGVFRDLHVSGMVLYWRLY